MTYTPSSTWSEREEQVRFHYDRARESSVRLIKSIVNNPRLSAEEQLDLLVRIAEGHKAISDFITTRVGVALPPDLERSASANA